MASAWTLFDFGDRATWPTTEVLTYTYDGGLSVGEFYDSVSDGPWWRFDVDVVGSMSRQRSIWWQPLPDPPETADARPVQLLKP